MMGAWFITALGIGLIVLGVWGRGAAADLVPPQLEAPVKEKRLRVMRRGAVVLQLAGLVFVAFGLFVATHPVPGG